MSFTRLSCISTYFFNNLLLYFICGVKYHIAHIENSNKSSKEREKNSKNRIENETEGKKERITKNMKLKEREHEENYSQKYRKIQNRK